MIISYGHDGYQPIMMRSSYRQSATKYIYSPIWEIFTDDFVKDVNKEIAVDIQTKCPKMILIKGDVENNLLLADPNLEPYIKEHYYRLPGDIPLEYIIYIKAS
jgi:hypothetical protein